MAHHGAHFDTRGGWREGRSRRRGTRSRRRAGRIWRRDARSHPAPGTPLPSAPGTTPQPAQADPSGTQAAGLPRTPGTAAGSNPAPGPGGKVVPRSREALLPRLAHQPRDRCQHGLPGHRPRPAHGEARFAARGALRRSSVAHQGGPAVAIAPAGGDPELGRLRRKPHLPSPGGGGGGRPGPGQSLPRHLVPSQGQRPKGGGDPGRFPSAGWHAGLRGDL